ncbi:T9SS type A sorting domain-containing protein [Flavivirga jejuensis]|uniref:T9SS type A sorting domain-containing protein n=1 Tax=Flavivirga jejuensis TaxID=870487 RepID=A0ABT8WSU2_9FLAO|nr:T9SS type A sorting domain-containing protein [Flavivirga jejuensis]MDO5976248.1 T9SS type A sorting domain-containing protein [Flavivirga jejuensis]
MKKTVIAACMLCAVFTIQAQQTIPASGNKATGSGGSSSYSVGQLVYTTNSDSDGTVTQGVQQSIELFTLSNPEITSINLSAVTFPNPTSDYIVLKISDSALNNLNYELYDINGKAMAIGKITNSDTQINMLQLAIGMYVLKINQNNQELKTFKIIKK